MDINDQKKYKSSDYLYLEKLKFNPELRKGWLNFFITNFRVVILLMALITLWGIYSFNKLPRESDPEVKIPFAVVSVVYPGVSPADMEELVTKKIEKKIAGIKGIKKITANSFNSMSSITVEFDAKKIWTAQSENCATRSRAPRAICPQTLRSRSLPKFPFPIRLFGPSPFPGHTMASP
jgi:multidrug efflux pump subunit AcrB